MVRIDGARAVARLSKRLEVALAGLELSLPQYRLLVFLSRRVEMASGLAGRLAVRPPTVTTLVDGMVARGLVERRPDAQDRRKVRHELTAAGRRTLAEAEQALEERLHALAAHLPAAQARRALDALELWHEALDIEAENLTVAT
jgi:DNA-binding MarR family transcriptional regulator